jgi:hypothetical protein
MFFDDGFEAQGEVNLVGAHIGGQLNFEGGKFDNPDGRAIQADGLHVSRDMFFDDGFEAQGEVNLVGAHIGGQLNCGGGKFRNPDDQAIQADGLQVDGGLFFDDGFEAQGEVRLLGAHVRGQLNCTGGKFRNRKGRALSADGLYIAGDLFLDDGFEAQGEVRLAGAHVSGQLACRGGKFRNPEGAALEAEELQVAGGLFFDDGFEAQGEVRLLGAHVRGELICTGGKFSNPGGLALDLERSEVTHLMLQPTVLEGLLDLTNAHVDHYIDGLASWPAQGHLRLRGFVYDTIDSDPSVSLSERLDWLCRDAGGFSPQPYEQLAATYRRSGEDDHATQVAIAKRRRRRARLNLFNKLLDRVLDALVGYGYRTQRAVVWLAMLLALGTVTFSIAHSNGLLKAANKTSPPDFNAVIYAVDWIVPILNLHQREAWVNQGIAEWLALGFATAGWVLTTAVVLGLSGVLKRD